MRTPLQVWHGRTTANSGDKLTDLAAVIRRYSRMPGARLMTRGQVPDLQPLTPLERALEETYMGKRTYDKTDPDNRPLTDEERRLQRIQDQGMRERQADQDRAGKRFDLLADSEWGTEHGNL